MVHTLHQSILREYDIRGEYQKTLVEEDAYFIGQAFGTTVRRQGGQNVNVARDGRLSSPTLLQALIRGLNASGCNVTDIGVGPSPMLYFSVYHLKADAGIMVTGSHNPPEYNGFKFMMGHDCFWGQNIQKLGQIIEEANFICDHGSSKEQSVFQDYLQHLKTEAPENLDLKIAWDAGNGATGEVVQELVKYLPGTHTVLNGEIDGTFPNHHPDPTIPEYLTQLKEFILENNYDMGIAFDGDGDRIGLMDSKGRLFYGDQLIALLSEDILANNDNPKIVADVKSSQFLFDFIASKGGQPIMWKSGHSLIRTKMKEEKALLAGEMSGHIFYSDRNKGYDDAVYAGLRLLSSIEKQQLNVTDIYDNFPELYHTPEVRFPCSDEQKFSIVDAVKQKLETSLSADEEIIDIDGIRYQNNSGWWLLRASNTQNLLVARCEAKNPADLEKLKIHLASLLEEQDITPPNELRAYAA